MIRRMRGSSTNRRPVLLALVTAAGLTIGCGQRQQPPAEQPEARAPAQSAASQPSRAPSEARPETSSNAGVVSQDASGRKWIGGEIPLDVWYDDPLAVANNTQPVRGSAVPAPSDASADEPPAAQTPAAQTSAAETASSGGAKAGIDWKSIIAKEILEDEVKQGTNRLKQNLISVGKFNGNYKEISADAVSISAMAGVAGRHPDAVSWKDKAAIVRDLSADVADNATSVGKSFYDATLLPFEELEVVLSGGPPADLERGEELMDFALHAERGALMRRMERADNWLRKEVRTADILKNEAQTVKHEAAVLAAMAKIITTPDYGSEDEDEYKKSAEEMFQASRAILTAVEADDFNAFGQAISAIKKACDECHQAYRFADDF